MSVSSVATVPRHPESTARLRSLLWTTFADVDEGIEEQLADAALVLSELMGNAVRHGRGETVRVRLRRTENLLRVAVQDDAEGHPIVKELDLDAEGGRGMMIIEALSERWGCDTLPVGKVVWAEMPLQGV